MSSRILTGYNKVELLLQVFYCMYIHWARKEQLFIVCKEYIPKCFLRKHLYMYFIFSNLIHIWFMQFYILWDKNLGNLGICLRC